MSLHIRIFLTALLSLLTAALLPLTPAAAKPVPGGYQFFEPLALANQNAIQLAALDNFDYHAKIAPDCGNVTKEDMAGCLSFEASGGGCTSGLIVSAANELASPFFSDGYVAAPNATAQEQERARKTYELDLAYNLGVVTGALTSGGDVSNIGRGSGITTSAIQNNRQLHVKEAELIELYADEYAIERGYCQPLAICSGEALAKAKAELTAETLRGVSDDFSNLKVNVLARGFLGSLQVAGEKIDGQTMFGQLDENSDEYRNSFQNADQFTKTIDLYTGVTAQRGVDGGYWALSAATQEAGYLASKSEIYGLGLGIEQLQSSYRTDGGDILSATGVWDDELWRNEQQAKGEALVEKLPFAIRKSELSLLESWGFDPNSPKIIAQSQAQAASVLGIGADAAAIGMIRAKGAAKGRTWTVDTSFRSADEAAGVLVNGSYIKNPTTRNLSESVTASGKIRVDGQLANGQYMYVVDTRGNIVIGTRGGQRMPHPTLIGGSNPQVQAAGIVDVRGGKIYTVDNASGHFKPGSGSLQSAESAFGSLPRNSFHTDFKGYVPFDD